MNIKDFLIENYIWILVVILLSIITVIGFIADKNKNKNKEPKENKKGKVDKNEPVENQQPETPISYQPEQMNNMDQNQNGYGFGQIPNNLGQISNTTITPLNQNMNEMPNQQLNVMPEPMMQNQEMNMNQNLQMNNNMNMDMDNPVQNNEILNQPVSNITPVENISQNNFVNPEPMYQPLSEQVPHFEPQQPTMEPMASSQQFNIPTIPVMPEPMMQNMNVVPEPTPAPMPTMNAIPVQDNMNNMNNFNSMNMGMNNPMPQNNNNGWMNNQPMQQNPNMSGQQMMNNNQGMMNFSSPQPMPMPQGEQSTVPNPITQPQPVNPAPISFVYGPNQNNNQNM